ncbi:MAG TPA: hypothetical protein VF107_11015 [Burkholderiaceae bacterium]
MTRRRAVVIAAAAALAPATMHAAAQPVRRLPRIATLSRSSTARALGFALPRPLLRVDQVID